MERIASFSVNHDLLTPGIYTSRVDGDITTYDIRMRRPNQPPFVEQGALHTLEHLFATIARNGSFADQIIYFGPMGCRTGCYLLVRNMLPQDVIALIVDTFRQIAEWEGEIPGAKRQECGNYKEHDLSGAKDEARRFLPVIQNWTAADLVYRS